MLCAVEKMVVILNLRLCGLFKRIEGRNIAKEIQTDSKKSTNTYKILLWRMCESAVCVSLCGQRWGGRESGKYGQAGASAAKRRSGLFFFCICISLSLYLCLLPLRKFERVRPSRGISCQKKMEILLLYLYFSLSVFVSVFSEKV